MLTMEAFNALLKTLEEPPSHVVFILATTEAHKVPATIQSRCQRYDFKRITKEDIEGQLKKIAAAMNLSYEPGAIALIAEKADGGLRDGISLFDQCLAMAQGDNLSARAVADVLGIVGQEAVMSLTQAIKERDVKKLLSLIEEVIISGKSMQQFFSEVLEGWRQMMIFKAAPSLLDDAAEGPSEKLIALAAEFSHERILAMAAELEKARQKLRLGENQRLVAEMSFLKLLETRPVQEDLPKDAANQIAKLAQKIDVLQSEVKRLEQGSAPSMARPKEIEKKAVPLEKKSKPSLAQPQGDLEDATKVWQELGNFLSQKNKRSALACLRGARPQGIQNGQLLLQVQNGFIKARIERDDYKKDIEAILKELTGKKLSIKCSLLEEVEEKEESVPQEAVPPPTDEDFLPDFSAGDLDEADRESIEKAMNVFGGKLVLEKTDE